MLTQNGNAPFTNTKKLFPIDSRQRYALLTITAKGDSQFAAVAFDLTKVSEIPSSSDALVYTDEEIKLLSPNTAQFPKIQDRLTKELLVKITRSGVPLLAAEIDAFGFSTAFIYEENKSRRFFCDEPSDSLVSVLEGKSFHQFDHRFANYDGYTKEDRLNRAPREVTFQQKADANYTACIGARLYADKLETANRWDSKFLRSFGFAAREVSNSTNERTVICAILPKFGVLHSAWIFDFKSLTIEHACWLFGNFNAFVFDYTARQKVTTSHLSKYVWTQLPVINPLNVTARDVSWHYVRVIELTFTSADLNGFALDCGYDGPPFIWNEFRRLHIRCELDAAYFHMYLGPKSNWGKADRRDGCVTDNGFLLEMLKTPRDAVIYIMDKFPIVSRNEEAKYGEYRTKRVILEIYDQMTEIIEANEAIRAANPGMSEEELRPLLRSYQSPLNPPPGPPTDANGNFIPYADWTEEIHRQYAGVIHIDSVSPSQRDKDRSRERQRLEQGQGILYLRLILKERNFPVQFEVLASDLCFALNSGLRRRFLLDEPVPENERSSASTTSTLPNLLAQVEALHANGVVTIEPNRGRRMVGLADFSGLDSDLSKAMAAHVKEAIEATTKLIGKREDDAFSADAFDKLHPFIKEDELENLTTL
ncbi:hypothetical protein SH449x_002779 [Pirellulaceae bacterium SH449]